MISSIVSYCKKLPANTILFGCVVMSAFALYHLKYEVIRQEQTLNSLKLDILAEKEAISVLRAEWAYHTNPDKLAQLSESYLNLEPLGPEKLIALEDIPLKESPENPGTGNGTGTGNGNSGTDPKNSGLLNPGLVSFTPQEINAISGGDY
jgi:hypothetical protein